MISSVSEMIRNESDTALFLVDIGVWGFHKLLQEYPERTSNIGIFEDGMISVASGMALCGFIPTIYGISPFIVERALEQLKLDFLYQKLEGNFITTGAAYDFSTLGYSHYCPEDLGIIKMLPGFEFVAPGTPEQFKTLFQAAHRDGKPTFFRLSDTVNKIETEVEFGKASVIQKGKQATVIAVSTTLDMVLQACKGLDVSILYYTTLEPFDYDTLKENYNNGKILLCEPHYEGTLLYDIFQAFPNKKIQTDCVGVKREVFRNYGTKEENDKYSGICEETIRVKLERLLAQE